MDKMIRIICFKVCTFFRRDKAESITVSQLGEPVFVPAWVEKTMTFAIMLEEGSVAYADSIAQEAQEATKSASEPADEKIIVPEEEQPEIPIVAAVEVVEEPIQPKKRTSKKKDDAK